MIENRVLEGAYASGEPYSFSLIRVKGGESTFAHLPISDKRWGYQRCFAIVRHYTNKWHWILLPIYNTYYAKQDAKCGRQSCERDTHVPSPPFPLWNPESTGTESTSVAGLNPEHRSEGLTVHLQHQPLSGLSKVLIPTPSFLGLGFYSVSTSAFSSFSSTVFWPTAILKPTEQQADLSNRLFSNMEGQWLPRAVGVGGTEGED